MSQPFSGIIMSWGEIGCWDLNIGQKGGHRTYGVKISAIEEWTKFGHTYRVVQTGISGQSVEFVILLVFCTGVKFDACSKNVTPRYGLVADL